MIELPEILKPYAKVIGATVVLLAALFEAGRDFALSGDDPAQIIGAVILWLSVFVPTNRPPA
jgi:hypothetical protein